MLLSQRERMNLGVVRQDVSGRIDNGRMIAGVGLSPHVNRARPVDVHLVIPGQL